MKHSADWAGYIVKAESAKDFTGLPAWLREAIMLDIQERMTPPKPAPQSVGIAEVIDKKSIG
ncbi:MAG: hypothetical protein ACLP56_02560 [Candidatus Sulfotelmatobacter sp.]